MLLYSGSLLLSNYSLSFNICEFACCVVLHKHVWKIALEDLPQHLLKYDDMLLLLCVMSKHVEGIGMM